MSFKKRLIYNLLQSLFILLNLPDLSAQYRLSGTVKDTNDSAVVCNILLKKQNALVQGALSDRNGKFVLLNVAKGDYLVIISSIGYTSEYIVYSKN
ncbi:MAG: carboxypeptidase regulatory-like domain-containing protein [Chloroflexia bacterium]|nr:carboxypeptidase regulatory-like domain-containing protein [Chloroflexia bacterium]